MTDAPDNAETHVEPGEGVEPATPATLPDDAPDAVPGAGEETVAAPVEPDDTSTA